MFRTRWHSSRSSLGVRCRHSFDPVGSLSPQSTIELLWLNAFLQWGLAAQRGAFLSEMTTEMVLAAKPTSSANGFKDVSSHNKAKQKGVQLLLIWVTSLFRLHLKEGGGKVGRVTP